MIIFRHYFFGANVVGAIVVGAGKANLLLLESRFGRKKVVSDD